MFLVLRSVSTSSVALLAEGVDRNNLLPYRCHAYRVALLAEGVDRNRDAGDAGPFSGQSPSSRRAWIEIIRDVHTPVNPESPSSRRAWIEIAKATEPAGL